MNNKLRNRIVIFGIVIPMIITTFSIVPLFFSERISGQANALYQYPLLDLMAMLLPIIAPIPYLTILFLAPKKLLNNADGWVIAFVFVLLGISSIMSSAVYLMSGDEFQQALAVEIYGSGITVFGIILIEKALEHLVSDNKNSEKTQE